METTERLDPFAPATIAADYVIAALGEDASLLVSACRAGWLIPEERAKLAPLADAVERLAR